MSDYISRLPSLPAFARVPVQLLIDPRVGPRQLLVFSILAAHARKNGAVSLTRERIAEMCGYYLGGRPNVDLVSRLISNPGHANQAKGPGPGLVQLGYVERGNRAGWNGVRSYKLVLPAVADTPLRIPANRRQDDYKERKLEEAQNAEKSVLNDDPDVFTDSTGCMWFRYEIANCDADEVPLEVYEHFGFTVAEAR